MMATEDDRKVDQALRTLADALIHVAEQRDEIRDAVHTLSNWLAERTAPTTPASESPEPTSSDAAVSTAPPPVPPKPAPPQIRGPRVPVNLQYGDARETIMISTPRGDEIISAQSPPPSRRDQFQHDDSQYSADRSPRGWTPIDLELILKRARLKCEGLEWAKKRRRLVDEQADHNTQIKPTDEDLLTRSGALKDCYLWMLDPYQQIPDDQSLDLIRHNYENLANAAEKAQLSEEQFDEDSPREELLYLIAEAQSALRVALDKPGISNDSDQKGIFLWLRDQTETHRVYINRYMKLDDPAEPNQWEQLRQRFEELESRWRQRVEHERMHSQLLNTLKYHVEKLPDADEDEIDHHWRKVLDTLREWVGYNFYPSDPQLYDTILPVVDDLPAELAVPAEAQHVLDAIERRRWNLESEETTTRISRPDPPEVLEARSLLQDRVAVLIGGEVKTKAKQALERDLGLRELRWVSAKPHQSLSTFEPEIAKPEVALVMLAIRWSSHSFGDVSDMCNLYNKPFVRLPAGYGSNQVAMRFLQQASEQVRTNVGT